MYYGEIKNCDIANGEGVRVTLFVSGCTNRCKNCFQPQTWAFDYGQPFTAETEEALLQMLAPAYINGLTLLGGEPFEPENQRGLLPFLRRVRDFAQVMGDGVVDGAIARKALTALDVDALGLDATDRRMLSTIAKSFGGGPVGLETLAAVIGEESVTLEDVYEPYLLQQGFLTRTPRGRCVTRRAYEHLGLEYIGQQEIDL